ncbi:hypothetical protein ACHWQZ_G018852 [Mnemiopsis leidyi]
MNEKLSLDRDFTRFLDDPTFPYKVTVCVGDKRILCSGALLAQQSSVLEKKFREDGGVLMFEELLDETNSNTDVMSEKLSLDRDFTRFLDDPTFPYKVTVCVGDKRILCSGALLAQQSSVLEKKFRVDDGVLMFEELLDETYSNTDAMSEKLNLDRDFTRFIDDPTFPYKVTVCVGDKRILCSGALLAQQSSVLEKKFREDDGVLMFEELQDETYSNTYGIMECIHYLHGAPLQFRLDTLPIILKFSSIYQVEGLFDRAEKWLKKYLDDSHCVKSALNFLKVSKSLDNNHAAQVKSVICGFIRQNRDLFGRECVNCLDTEITGQDLILIIGQHPANSGQILMKWTSLSVENGNYIAKNHSKFDFNELFPDSKQFSSFISNLTFEAKSTDMLKNLLDLQRTFFESQKDQKNQATNESGTSHSSEAGSARLNFGPGKDASMSSVSRNISWTGNTLTYTGPFDSSINVRNLPTAVSNLLPNFLSYNSFEQHSSDESSEEEFTATRLYIGNLPPQAEETAIRRMFSGFGRITNVKITLRNHGNNFGFISFENSTSAYNLLQRSETKDYNLYGYKLVINEAHRQN